MVQLPDISEQVVLDTSTLLQPLAPEHFVSGLRDYLENPGCEAETEPTTPDAVQTVHSGIAISSSPTDASSIFFHTGTITTDDEEVKSKPSLHVIPTTGEDHRIV